MAAAAGRRAAARAGGRRPRRRGRKGGPRHRNTPGDGGGTWDGGSRRTRSGGAGGGLGTGGRAGGYERVQAPRGDRLGGDGRDARCIGEPHGAGGGVEAGQKRKSGASGRGEAPRGQCTRKGEPATTAASHNMAPLKVEKGGVEGRVMLVLALTLRSSGVRSGRPTWRPCQNYPRGNWNC